MQHRVGERLVGPTGARTDTRMSSASATFLASVHTSRAWVGVRRTLPCPEGTGGQVPRRCTPKKGRLAHNDLGDLRQGGIGPSLGQPSHAASLSLSSASRGFRSLPNALEHATESTPLVERHVLEVVLLDPQAARDVILDRVQPFPLDGREGLPDVFLLREPLAVAGIHLFGDRDERPARVRERASRWQQGPQAHSRPCPPPCPAPAPRRAATARSRGRGSQLVDSEARREAP